MSHNTEAMKLGRHGCGMDNKKPRSVKHQHDRLIDKRRRRIGKKFVRRDNFMSERTELLSICYHADDDTGLHHIGEIDFGVNARLESYIEKYGYKGVEEILAMLGHLAWEVKDCFYKINRKTEVKEKENEKPLICSYESSCHDPDMYLSC